MVTFGIGEMTGVVAAVTRALSDDPWLENLARLGGAYVILALPTSAMGATLPTLVRVGVWGRGVRTGFGPPVPAGTLWGPSPVSSPPESILIRMFGVTGSAWIATLLSLAAASAALWLSRGGQGEPSVDAQRRRRRIVGTNRGDHGASTC